MSIRLRTILLAILVSTPATAAPRYYIRTIASVEDCHREYDRLVGGWRTDASFMRSMLPGDREHVLNCLTDGVEEFVCNPTNRKLVVAIVVGRTEQACRAFTPKLPATVEPIFAREGGAPVKSAGR